LFGSPVEAVSAAAGDGLVAAVVLSLVGDHRVSLDLPFAAAL